MLIAFGNEHLKMGTFVNARANIVYSEENFTEAEGLDAGLVYCYFLGWTTGGGPGGVGVGI